MPKFVRVKRSWRAKFGSAFSGIWKAARGQSSFAVHCVMALIVLAAASLLQASLYEWLFLLLCIFNVLAAETFNSALERLALAITDEHNEHIASALDMASGAVLAISAGAAIIGGTIFGRLLLVAAHASS